MATNAWDRTCGGGLWWSYARQYKNAITNELFFAMAAKLHRLQPSGVVQEWTYRTWAIETWEWFLGSGMINAQGLVNDGLNTPDSCVNNGRTEWTYNQGVVLGGLIELYSTTGDTDLLTKGVTIAEATLERLVWRAPIPTGPGILQESCESASGSTCDADQQQFKGIFVRYLRYFCYGLPPDFAAPKRQFEAWLAAQAESVWGADRNGANMSEKWVGPFGGAGAIMQTSATDALLAGPLRAALVV